MLPGRFCMQQPLSIYPSNYKLLAMTASAYELVGVCIFTLDFPGPMKLGQTGRQVSVSCIILLYG